MMEMMKEGLKRAREDDGDEMGEEREKRGRDGGEVTGKRDGG